MSLQDLQDQLALWQSPGIAATMVQDRKERLVGDINNPNVDVELKTACIATLAALEADEQAYIDRHIAAFQRAINAYGDFLPDQGAGVDE